MPIAIWSRQITACCRPSLLAAKGGCYAAVEPDDCHSAGGRDEHCSAVEPGGQGLVLEPAGGRGAAQAGVPAGGLAVERDEARAAVREEARADIYRTEEAHSHSPQHTPHQPDTRRGYGKKRVASWQRLLEGSDKEQHVLHRLRWNSA